MHIRIDLTLVLILFSLSIAGQELNKKPDTGWPFLFEEFSECSVLSTFAGTNKITANFNLLNGEIQFLNNENLLTLVNKKSIVKVSFKKYTFVPFNEAYYMQLNRHNKFNLYKKIYGNSFDISESANDYGKPGSSASKQNTSGINIVQGRNNSYTTFDNDENGKAFRILKRFYFTGPENSKSLIPLNKRALNRYLRDNKKTVAVYIKNNKIRFKNEPDLIKLFSFINSLN
ncbi:hypothetical protein [Saccharicrinis sp. FJH54]|uniref:hypothetical protein n=1 Tax=Saccharicrinis sp. FJH54 TaxID=3344665 RepID=UPI0035D3E9DB